MKILVVGSSGQVGFELLRTLRSLGDVHGVDYPEVDLAKPDSVRALVREWQPDVLANAAAYTAVDKAESEPEKAMAVNGIAPGVMAEEMRRLDGTLVHYSTDYVYDGNKDGPYDERDMPNPQNVYGRTKLAGDMAVCESRATHLVFRTSWVYGSRGSNFLLTMLRLFEQKPELRIVDDQFGAPTWCRHIAEVTAQVLARCFRDDLAREQLRAEQTGIYHLTAGGSTTWHGFAKAIHELRYAEKEHGVPRLSPIPSSEYPALAKRPSNSLLNNEKIRGRFAIEQQPWEAHLKACYREIRALG
jgi:dTDP-4-dehydrorhamnose reductase